MLAGLIVTVDPEIVTFASVTEIVSSMFAPALIVMFPSPAKIASLNSKTIFAVILTAVALFAGVDEVKVGITPSTLCEVEIATALCDNVAELPAPSLIVPEFSSNELVVIPVPSAAKSPLTTVYEKTKA